MSKKLSSLLSSNPSTTTPTAGSKNPTAVTLFTGLPSEVQKMIQALPNEQRLFVTAYFGACNVTGAVEASEKMKNYGFSSYTDSSIYLKSLTELDSLIRTLSNILQIMAGETKSDFRRVNLQDGKYVTIAPPEDCRPKILDKDSVTKLQLESGEQRFPEYNSFLAEYVSGRYEAGLSKPPYKNMEYMINHFEKDITSRDLFDTYISNPIENLIASFKDNTNRQAQEQRALEMYQGEKKFDFKYLPSERAQSIFRRLKAIYLDLLRIQEGTEEDKKKGLDSKLVPMKRIGLYISDVDLKNGNLRKLAVTLDAPHILDYMEEMDAKNYKQWYVNIRNLYEILNAILGEMNWTIEPTYSKEIEGGLLIRGYYVDMLGNFKYGQLVTDRSVFGNSDVNKDATMKSLLARSMITDTFQTVRGLTVSEYESIRKMKQDNALGAVSQGLLKWAMYKNMKEGEVPKSVETTSIMPVKRQTEAIDYKPEKVSIDDSGSFEKVKQDAPKEVTQEARTVIIEEMK